MIARHKMLARRKVRAPQGSVAGNARLRLRSLLASQEYTVSSAGSSLTEIRRSSSRNLAVPSKSEAGRTRATETSLRSDSMLLLRVKRGNLYAEQNQIGLANKSGPFVRARRVGCMILAAMPGLDR